MEKKSPSSKSTVGKTTLHGGLSKKSPKRPDASMGMSGASVDSGTTRSGVAKTPRSLGPRTA